MTPHTKSLLRKHIIIGIQEAEGDEDYKLLDEDVNFLTNAILDFIEQSSIKFIVGAKEHNGDEHPTPFLTSCPHLIELPKEIYDAYFYSYAAIKSIRSNRSQ